MRADFTLEEEINLMQNARRYWETRRKRGLLKIFFLFHNLDVARKIEQCDRQLNKLLKAKEGKTIYERHFKPHAEQVRAARATARHRSDCCH